MLVLKIILATIAALLAFAGFIGSSQGLYMNFLRDLLKESIGPRTHARLAGYWTSLKRSSSSLFIDELSRALRWAKRFKARQRDWTLSLIAISILITRLAMFPESVTVIKEYSNLEDTAAPQIMVSFKLALRWLIVSMLLLAIIVQAPSSKVLWLSAAAMLSIGRGFIEWVVYGYLTEMISFPVLVLLGFPFLIVGAILFAIGRRFLARYRSAWGWLLFFLLLAFTTEVVLRASRLLPPPPSDQLMDSIGWHATVMLYELGVDLEIILLFALNYVFDKLTIRETIAYMKDQVRTDGFTWSPLLALFVKLLRYAVLVFLGAAALDALYFNLTKPLYSNIPVRIHNPVRFPGFYWYALSTLLPIAFLFIYLGLRAFSGYLVRRASSWSQLFMRSAQNGTDPIYLSYMSVMLLLSILGAAVSWAVAFNALSNVLNLASG